MIFELVAIRVVWRREKYRIADILPQGIPYICSVSYHHSLLKMATQPTQDIAPGLEHGLRGALTVPHLVTVAEIDWPHK